MPQPALEILRASIPAARSLPLLRQIAARKPGRAVVEYLDVSPLTIEVDPCAPAAGTDPR
jgi:hypothetical protein